MCNTVIAESARFKNQLWCKKIFYSFLYFELTQGFLTSADLTAWRADVNKWVGNECKVFLKQLSIFYEISILKWIISESVLINFKSSIKKIKNFFRAAFYFYQTRQQRDDSRSSAIIFLLFFLKVIRGNKSLTVEPRNS